jgi:peptide/nickel transport system ATP-binding protein
MPTLTGIPPGCAFHPRCGQAMDICERLSPLPRPGQAAESQVACHQYPEAVSDSDLHSATGGDFRESASDAPKA